MRWVITKDLINAEDGGNVHWIGRGRGHNALRELTAGKPREAAELAVQAHILGREQQALRADPNHVIGSLYPFEFRLLDGDGEVYYEGRCGDLDQADEEAAFAPQDWAEANDGVTTMEYRRVGETEWKVL